MNKAILLGCGVAAIWFGCMRGFDMDLKHASGVGVLVSGISLYLKGASE